MNNNPENFQESPTVAAEQEQPPANYFVEDETLELEEGASAVAKRKTRRGNLIVIAGAVFTVLLVAVGYFIFASSDAPRKQKNVTVNAAANNSKAVDTNKLDRELDRLAANTNTHPAPSSPVPNPDETKTVSPQVPQNAPNPILTDPLSLPANDPNLPIYNPNPVIVTPAPSPSSGEPNGKNVSSDQNAGKRRDSNTGVENADSRRNVSGTQEVRGKESDSRRFTAVRGSINPQQSFYLKQTSGASEVSSGSFNYQSVNPVFAAKPQFGTVLPIKVMGALHSLQPGGIVRFVLTRTITGNGWKLDRGTIFIGKVQGSSANRLFVSVNGYLDPRINGLVEIRGDLLDLDGSLGLLGERKRLQNRWKKVLAQSLNAAKQLGMSYLQGRRGGGVGFIQPDQSGLIPSGNSESEPSFVVVNAGATGYVIVNDLPPVQEVPLAPLGSKPAFNESPEALAAAPRNVLSDEQMLELLTKSNPAEIRANLPNMSPVWRVYASQYLAEKE